MTTTTSDRRDNPGILRILWRNSGALRAGLTVGAFAGMVLLVLYGIAVALLADRLHAPPPVRRGRRVDPASRVVWCLVAAAMCVISFFSAMDFADRAGTCLAADGEGDCALRSDR